MGAGVSVGHGEKEGGNGVWHKCNKGTGNRCVWAMGPHVYNNRSQKWLHAGLQSHGKGGSQGMVGKIMSKAQDTYTKYNGEGTGVIIQGHRPQGNAIKYR